MTVKGDLYGRLLDSYSDVVEMFGVQQTLTPGFTDICHRQDARKISMAHKALKILAKLFLAAYHAIWGVHPDTGPFNGMWCGTPNVHTDKAIVHCLDGVWGSSTRGASRSLAGGPWEAVKGSMRAHGLAWGVGLQRWFRYHPDGANEGGGSQTDT